MNKNGMAWQVCSLELSQTLENLGVKQKSLFYWCEYIHSEETDSGHGEVVTDWLLENNENIKRKGLDVGLTFSAFTVAELGEMLPASIGDKTWLSYTKSLNGWNGICEKVSYDKWEYHQGAGQLLIKHVHEISNHPYTKEEQQTLTEADARAKMLIYLLEQKLISQTD